MKPKHCNVHAQAHKESNACPKFQVHPGENSKEPDLNICLINLVPPCVVYSFGISNNWDFDQAGRIPP